MPIVQVEHIYRQARSAGYGVGGFCAENLEMILAILQAAEATESPVVVALWEKDIDYAGEGSLEAIVTNYASRTAIPIGIMLDHGTSLQSCLRAVASGHTCVMMDASHESFEGNVERTREVCMRVHPMGVIVEGEIGTIRRTFESEGDYAAGNTLTDPSVAAAYVRESGADAVAVSVGTESGLIKQQIDFDRLKRIADMTDAFIVIHGGSCTPDADVRRAVRCGVTAFRFASENRVAYLDAVERARKILPLDFPDTRLIYGKAVNEVKELIAQRMIALGCAGMVKRFA